MKYETALEALDKPPKSDYVLAHYLTYLFNCNFTFALEKVKKWRKH